MSDVHVCVCAATHRRQESTCTVRACAHTLSPACWWVYPLSSLGSMQPLHYLHQLDHQYEKQCCQVAPIWTRIDSSAVCVYPFCFIHVLQRRRSVGVSSRCRTRLWRDFLFWKKAPRHVSGSGCLISATLEACCILFILCLCSFLDFFIIWFFMFNMNTKRWIKLCFYAYQISCVYNVKRVSVFWFSALINLLSWSWI